MKLLTLFLACALGGYAQESTSTFTGHLWLDTFGGTEGVVIYPQYAFHLETGLGAVNGFGFDEIAPHQEMFTNHLVNFSPKRAKWFAVHTETGALPRRDLGFFQIGPRVNVTEVLPILKKPLDHVFVAALPRFIGIRPNNLLVSASTNRFPITQNVKWSVEWYHRYFPHGPGFEEYWFLVHPKQMPRVSFAAHILHSGEIRYVDFGLRMYLL